MTQTTTSIATLLPVYYDRLLLDNLYPDLFLYQFGEKRRLPRNFGKQITFTRYFSTGTSPYTPSKVTEGTIIGQSALSAETINATLSGFASAVGVTDFIVMTAISDVVRGSVFELSKKMALAIDNTIRLETSAFGSFIDPTGGSTVALIKTNDVMTFNSIARGVAKLRQNDARTWPDGNFALVTHPRVAFDVRNDATAVVGWTDVHRNASNETAQAIYRGQTGTVGGASVVESSNTKQLLAVSPVSAANSGFQSLLIAPGAYGVVELDGNTASVFVKQVGSAGSDDPVNQKGSVGIKTYFALAQLQSTRFLRIGSGGASL